jgi:hypothetical protein
MTPLRTIKFRRPAQAGMRPAAPRMLADADPAAAQWRDG